MKKFRMGRVTAFVIVVLASISMTLTACTPSEQVVNVFNWEDYIDPEVNSLFTKETGIKVNYYKFTVNEDMYVKVTSQPGMYDVLFPSDYMIERMIREERLEKPDKNNIPNLKEINPWQFEQNYDKGGEYSVPYMWGTVGILYNPDMVEGSVDSWDALWDIKNKGNVFMMDSVRDSVGIALIYAGYSLNSSEPEALEAAKQALIRQKQEGIVKAYTVDESKDKMVANEAALALMWSGDAAYAQDKNDNLEYAIPKEGSNMWFDAMVIPKGAKNKKNAETYMNFLCRPDIALMNAEYIGYSSPNNGAIALMDDETKENKTIFPDEESLEKCEVMRDLSQDIEKFDQVWMEVKAAN